MLVTAMATPRVFGVTGGWCSAVSGKTYSARAQTSCRASRETHSARVPIFSRGVERGWCGTPPVRCVRVRATRRWQVVASSDALDNDDANDSSGVSFGDGVSTRVVDPEAETTSSPQMPPAPPKRRRGRPKGTRKVTNAPVPGDTLGVASLLWRLASDDEALNGTARIQPHGLEAVVPTLKKRKDGENDDRENGASDANTNHLTPQGDDETTKEDSSAASVVTEFERTARAKRSAGVVRSSSTNAKNAKAQRERWAKARVDATAIRTSELAAQVVARRTAAIASAKRAAYEGGAAAADAAARDVTVGDSGKGDASVSPWEQLATGGAFAKKSSGPGTFQNASRATDAQERAAAFAALLIDASGVNQPSLGDVDKTETTGAWGSSTGGGVIGPGLGPGNYGTSRFAMSIDQSSDEDTPEEIELRATKRKMKEQLDNLARRRAEMIGNTGAPSSVTVAKFTNELARYKRLRADLEEWSNAFSEKYQKRPTLKDVERTGIDFLVENFKEYVELRDKLMGQTPHLRGQIEDVAKATLPAPRALGGGASFNANTTSSSRRNASVTAANRAGGGASTSAARRIAAAREGKYGAGISAALGMEGVGLGSTPKVSTPGAEGVKKYGANAGSTTESVNRAASLAQKGGGASAEANLAMKRAAAYREQRVFREQKEKRNREKETETK